jgi:hypothetical protein
VAAAYDGSGRGVVVARAEVEVAAQFGKIVVVWANENTGVEKGEKGNAQFPNPAYIHWLTDEHRRAHNGSPAPQPLNICHVIDEYMGLVKVKPDDLYVHQFSAQTDEYNFIFIIFGTDEYNLNIFVGTNEYIITDE